MTSRVAYGPQDFQKMCRQAERDHESRRLAILMERVQKQIAERGMKVATGNASVPAESNVQRIPSRSVPLER
jgi:hypothetical protein